MIGANKDAQFFRALKKSGQWDTLKEGKLLNYKSGGTVGAGSYAAKLSNSKSNDRPMVNNYSSNVVYNLHGNGNTLRQSVLQIEADRQKKQERIYKRNK